MSRTIFRVFLLAAFSQALCALTFAQTVTVDKDSANTGNLTNALIFGGNRTFTLPGAAGRAPTPVTFPTGAGIASNRGSVGNVGGLDFFTALPFMSNPAVRMSITNAGRVGIGTLAPTRALQINGNGDVELGLLGSDATGQNGRLWTLQSSAVVPAGGTNANLSGTFQIIDRTASLSRFQIDPTGLVSVNTLRILGGADLAEPFSVTDEPMAPGSVVVIDADHPGRLKLSDAAYDTRVAGVVSGAGGIRTALTLTQADDLGPGASTGSHQNIALSGRVYVQADATGAPIQPGDLLTTSNRSGFCMKAADYDRARGAILGKAMSSLAKGSGLVLVLVSLQ